MKDLYSKTEHAFADYLHIALPGGVTIRRARDGGPPVEGPLLLIHSVTATQAEDFPASDGTYELDLSLILSGEKGAQFGTLQPFFGLLQSALLDLTRAKAWINTTAQDLHLHDIEIVDHVTSVDDNRPTNSISAKITITNAAS